MTLSRRAGLQRLWRYYQAGIANTLFGYACYVVLIKLGL